MDPQKKRGAKVFFNRIKTQKVSKSGGSFDDLNRGFKRRKGPVFPRFSRPDSPPASIGGTRLFAIDLAHHSRRGERPCKG